MCRPGKWKKVEVFYLPRCCQARKSVNSIIRKNLERILQRVEQACTRSHRDPDDVVLVAVTKYAEWDWVKELARHHHVLGEARPQQLADRSPLLPSATWHLIGQLQRNKARLALDYADTIHSVDSLKLLNRLHVLGQETDRRPELLLQVNVTREAAKAGFVPDELRTSWPEIVDRIAEGANVTGLMTMGKLGDSPEETRRTFRQLAELRDELNADSSGEPLTELSMGMTNDFEVAVEEGATLIRVGRAIFEGAT